MRVRTDRATATQWRYDANLAPGGVARACGNCSSPVRVEIAGAPGSLRGPTWRDAAVVYADIDARCRKCPECLRARAALWRSRAMNELRAWPRTWLVTLTLSPENQYRVLAAVEAKERVGGGSADDLSPTDLFAERCRVIGPHVTRYLKRVRRNADAPLRYLLVFERHKSGLPHLHLLVHELDAARPLRHKVVCEAWKLGFSSAKLCDRAAASYVAKYLSKEAASRVRASLRYGDVLGHSSYDERGYSDP